MSDDNLLNKTIDAFEESTGEPPNDYEMAQIKILVDEEGQK
jgi:hypothetical protein